MDAIWLMVVFAVGFYLGATAMRAFQRHTTVQTLKELNLDTDTLRKVTDKIKSEYPGEDGYVEIRIKVEQQGDQIYAYRKDTDEFLGQAANAEELKDVIAKKVKRAVRLVIAEEDGADYVQ